MKIKAHSNIEQILYLFTFSRHLFSFSNTFLYGLGMFMTESDVSSWS